MMYDERRETDSDPRIVEDIIAEHFPFDCNLIPIDAHTWAIHGSIPVAGDVILAEFSNREDAEAALKLLSAAEKTSRVPDSPPEAEEVDEELSMELHRLSTNAGLRGRPSGDAQCDNCLYYLENSAAFSYCWHPKVRILVGAEWSCQWWERGTESQGDTR